MKKVTDSRNFNGKKYEVRIVIVLITLSMDIQFKNFFFFFWYTMNIMYIINLPNKLHRRNYTAGLEKTSKYS